MPRARGEGIEFADLRAVPARRPAAPRQLAGERAGAGRLYVNDYHPERNADVVLFLDSFPSRRPRLDLAVRRGIGAGDRYLRGRDRVGIVGFGGVLRWVLPRPGARRPTACSTR